MRAFSLLVLLALLPQANAQENEAEKLFREMAKKIQSAKSMHINFEVEQSDAGNGVKDGKGKGTFDLERRQISDGAGIWAAETVVYLGRQIRIFEFYREAADLPRQNSSNNEKSLQLLAYGGPMLFFSTTFLGPPQKFNENFLKIKDFKLVGKEKIDAHDTQVVQYVGEIGPEKSTITFSMWIDTKTKIPVKLNSVSQPQKNSAAITQRDLFQVLYCRRHYGPEVVCFAKVIIASTGVALVFRRPANVRNLFSDRPWPCHGFRRPVDFLF